MYVNYYIIQVLRNWLLQFFGSSELALIIQEMITFQVLWHLHDQHA